MLIRRNSALLLHEISMLWGFYTGMLLFVGVKSFYEKREQRAGVREQGIKNGCRLYTAKGLAVKYGFGGANLSLDSMLS